MRTCTILVSFYCFKKLEVKNIHARGHGIILWVFHNVNYEVIDSYNTTLLINNDNIVTSSSFSELVTTQLREFHMVSPQVVFTLLNDNIPCFLLLKCQPSY